MFLPKMEMPHKVSSTPLKGGNEMIVTAFALTAGAASKWLLAAKILKVGCTAYSVTKACKKRR